MEKNWIEEIREFIRKAMNEGLRIKACNYRYPDEVNEYYEFIVYNRNSTIKITFIEIGKIYIETSKGDAKFDIALTKRDMLELSALVLSVDEYNEDMVLSDFNNFIGEEEKKEVNINDLNDDDE